MRDPTAAVKAKRIRDATDAARDELLRMFRWLSQDEKNPTAAGYKYAVSLVIRLLNDASADKLIPKYVSAPDARDKIISFLRQGRPPLQPKAGGREKTLRDFLLADIIENVRRRGFDVHRGDATRDDPRKSSIQHSACSIVATAWREMESEVRENREPRRTRLLELGFAPLKNTWLKALSEASIERIWDKSEWAKARTSRS
jgi:hypothetical protein